MLFRSGGGGSAEGNSPSPGVIGFGGGGYTLYSAGSPWLGTPFGGGSGSRHANPTWRASSGNTSTGGGGGAGGYYLYYGQVGAAGGSGVVVLKYYAPSTTIWTFANTQQWLVPDGITTVDYLVVAGGGGGSGGGGGAGGLLTEIGRAHV